MLLKPAGASSCFSWEQPVSSAILAQIASDCSSPGVVITISTWVFSFVSFEIFLQLIFLWKKGLLLTINWVSCLPAKHLQQHIISALLMSNEIQELHAHVDLCYTVWNYIGNAWISCFLLSFALFSCASINYSGKFHISFIKFTVQHGLFCISSIGEFPINCFQILHFCMLELCFKALYLSFGY